MAERRASTAARRSRRCRSTARCRRSSRPASSDCPRATRSRASRAASSCCRQPATSLGSVRAADVGSRDPHHGLRDAARARSSRRRTTHSRGRGPAAPTAASTSVGATRSRVVKAVPNLDSDGARSVLARRPVPRGGDHRCVARRRHGRHRAQRRRGRPRRAALLRRSRRPTSARRRRSAMTWSSGGALLVRDTSDRIVAYEPRAGGIANMFAFRPRDSGRRRPAHRDPHTHPAHAAVHGTHRRRHSRRTSRPVPIPPG